MHGSLEKFKPYIEKKLLREVISPCKKLVLYNYTDLCTYERAWDEVTLNARGTVYEIATGKVVARAFPKFFNYSELSQEKQQEVLQSKSFETFEKMDGSLGIVYYYDGEWRVNTRGSFTSYQAVKGKKMLDGKYNTRWLIEGCTYLVEIIYPENKIIVDYGSDEKLIQLAQLYHTGCEVDFNIARLASPFKKASVYNFDSIEELQEHLATLDHTEEGYVVRLEDGTRVKFKSRAYLDVARIIQNMSPLSFWKTMENGKVKSEFIEQLPEEFREESERLKKQMEDLYYIAYTNYASDFITAGINLNMSRKDITFLCKEKGLNLSAMFAFLDERADVIDKIVLKQIRPHGNTINE